MAAAKKTPTPSKKPPRATVRTYRHGLGDCHLVTLYGARKTKYQIMIDCGVILGTANAGAVMTEVMDDILAATGGSIDLLVATHEHWDHLPRLRPGRRVVRQTQRSARSGWAGPRTRRTPTRSSCAASATTPSRCCGPRPSGCSSTGGGDGEPTLLTSLLDFFGAAARTTTASALELVRAKGGLAALLRRRTCRSSSTVSAAASTAGSAARHEDAQEDAAERHGARDLRHGAGGGRASIGQALANPEQQPFSNAFRIPEPRVAQSTPFFQQRYWNDEAWRRIDVAWMDDASELALALDSMTNNTTLVLAIDLDDVRRAAVRRRRPGRQLAHVERLQVACRRQAGHRPDLLARTVYYKVGHHGSHNATLKAGGLERMTALDVAVIPVNHAMALKKKWGDIPLDALVTALGKATTERGLPRRTDQELSATAKRRGARMTRLYVEVDVF